MVVDPAFIVLSLLGSVTVLGLYFSILHPYLSGDIRVQRRLEAIRANQPMRVRETRIDAERRRKAVSESLQFLDVRSQKKETLETRLSRAGLTMTKKKFIILSVVSGVFFTFLVFLTSQGLIYAFLAGFAGGLGLPRWLLSYLAKKRTQLFLNELPSAVDIIVRGIKAGLPLGDCFTLIAKESKEPVRSIFEEVVNSQKIGVPQAEAVRRIFTYFPVPEANFFVTAIYIQQQSGGNLADTLSNLSQVLRERKQLRLKIKAMSSEARASAFIIGALPFIVGTLIYITSPDYISVMWNVPTGRFVLAGAAVWMLIGISVMRQMINFDF